MNPEVAAALEAAQATMVGGGDMGYVAMKRQRMNHVTSGMQAGMQPGMHLGMQHMHPMHGHHGGVPMRMHTPQVLPALKLRGLPFSATESDVRNFFDGFDIIDILFVMREGRPSGIVFVLLGSSELAEIAMAQHNKGIMGRRYIDIFPASREEYYQAVAGHVAHVSQMSQDGVMPMAMAPTPASMPPKNVTELTSLEVRNAAFSATVAMPRLQIFMLASNASTCIRPFPTG